MKKKLAILLIIAAIGGAAAIGFGGSAKNNTSELKEVIVKPAEKGTVIASVVAEGSVEVKNEESIYVSKSMRIDEVLFEEDDVVNIGDKLITFDPEERNDLIREIQVYELKIEEEKLNLEEEKFEISTLSIDTAKRDIEELEVEISKYEEDIKIAQVEKTVLEKELENAQLEYEINEKLFKVEGISLTEFNTYEEAKDNLEKDLESKNWEIAEYGIDLKEAEKNLVLANKTLANEELTYKQDLITQKNDIRRSELTIKEYEIEIETLKEELEKTVEYVLSPVEGTITEVNAEENFKVNLEESLMTISDINSQIITATVSSYDINKVEIGQKVNITCDALADGAIIEGSVESISSLATTDSGSGYEDIVVEVEISFDSETSGLKPGYDVDVAIVTGTKDNAVTIPSFALNTKKGRKFVYILGEDNTVRRQQVEVGIETSTTVEVLNLNGNEKIIMNGSNLNDGEEVKVVDRMLSDVPEKKGAGGPPA